MNEERPQPQGFLHWLKESVTVKLVFISILILLLLIPSAMVQNLVQERADRQEDTIKQVSDQYSGSQLIQGPILVIPYKKLVKGSDSQGKEFTKEIIDNIYVLPDELNYKAIMAP
jgi:inner membrane protein